MARILLRSGKDPFTPIPPENALANYRRGVWGRNVGNFVFTDAVHRIISTPDTEVVSNSYLSERPGVTRHYIDRINDEFDAFVIPLANAFRPKFLDNLTRLTKVVEGLRIPTVVVGVGVAGGVGSLDNPLPTDSAELTTAVQRFVSAVLERSGSIGVRGDFTREYLARLGYGDEHVDVVGCPSLFRDGEGLRIEKRAASLTPDSEFTINISPYVRAMQEIGQRHAEKYGRMIYIPQDDTTLELLLWGKDLEPRGPERLPQHTGHLMYRENRIRFFVDTVTWMQFLARQDFSFGTRIHGNIVALSAGTPAHVLAHDARTLELARFHDIPHTLVPDLPEKVDAADLYEQSDYTTFNTGHAQRFRDFVGFLERNGVRHVFEPGLENPDYDARLAAVEFPPPVQNLLSTDPEYREVIAERVAKLYGAAGPKAVRSTYKPEYPF
ncbi:MAG: polysaccharide pyruvyl transferase family protein, partial [Actinomycetales bacterium]|nr:polysaccharide pyruvyl transferase family protein [Actinomycetales bacterium]